MKTWSKTKIVMGLAGLASLAVVANVTFERSLYSDAFMIDQGQAVVSRRLDDSFARVVASENIEDKIAVKYIELNDENRKKINGAWEVMRGFEDVNDQVKEFYNKFTTNASSVVKVDMELAAGGVWVRGEEFENFFYISDITEAGTISIVRRLNDKHFEVLEAKKIKEVIKPQPSVRREQVARTEPERRDYKKGVALERDLEMVMERALVPEISKDVIVGDMVSGSLSLSGGNINAMSAVVRAADGQERSIDISYAEIKDGGQFQVDYMGEIIHGIITNNGTDAYRVRFATGPMQGAMLNFMTYEQLDIMREREEEARYKAEEAAAEKAYEQETLAAPPLVEPEQPVYGAPAEDSVVLFEQAGFNFSQERKPASIIE